MMMMMMKYLPDLNTISVDRQAERTTVDRNDCECTSSDSDAT